MSSYPPDTKECPRCDSTETVRLAWKCDETWEVWECDACEHEWDIPIGPDPDDERDQRRDDKMTGDDA